MKQGRASRDGNEGWKREPRPKAILPAAVAEIGIARGNHVTEGGDTGWHGTTMNQGRGFKAPMDAGRKIHRSGSQGRS